MSLARFIENTFFVEGKNIPLRFFNMLGRNKFSTRKYKKIFILMMPKYSRIFRLGPF